MPRRPMTAAEKLVGRPMPKDASYRDQLMAGFIREDGSACGRMAPSESWLRPAHTQARKNGWIKAAPVKFAVMSSRPEAIWYPTESGLEEAKAAKQRVQAATEARRAWSTEWKEVFGYKPKTAPDEANTAPTGP